MTPFDPQQMPSMLQNILALSGGGADQSGGSASPQANPAAPLQDLGDKSVEDWVKRHKDIEADRDRYNKLLDNMGDIKPDDSKVEQAVAAWQSFSDPNSPESQQRKASIDQLKQKLSTMPSLPDALKDRDKYINNRIEQAYGGKFDDQGNLVGHSKLGLAAQLLQDLLRSKNAPSGRQAVYQQAGKEYDQTVKDTLEKAQADRASAKNQLDLMHQEYLEQGQGLKDAMSFAQFREGQRKTNLETLNRAANTALSGTKFDAFLQSEDGKNMFKAYQAQYGNKPEEAVLPEMVKDLMSTEGLSRGQAGAKASLLLSVIKAYQRGGGTTSISTETYPSMGADGRVIPGVTERKSTPNNVANPAAMQQLQQFFGRPQFGQPLPQPQGGPQAAPQPQPQPQGQPGASPLGQAAPQLPPTSHKSGPPGPAQGPVPPAQPQAQSPTQAPTQILNFRLKNGNIGNPSAVSAGMLRTDPLQALGTARGGNDKLTNVRDQKRAQAQEVWDRYDEWAPKPWDSKEMGMSKPTWSEDLYKHKEATEKLYADGKVAQQINALNTAVNHLGEFASSAKQLGNSDVRMVNWFNNYLSKNIGDGTAVTNTAQIADRLGKELENTYVAGGGTGRERSDIEREMSVNAGVKQLGGGVATNIKLLSGLIDSLQTSYARNTYGLGTKTVLMPAAKAVLSNLVQKKGDAQNDVVPKNAQEYLEKLRNGRH